MWLSQIWRKFLKRSQYSVDKFLDNFIKLPFVEKPAENLKLNGTLRFFFQEDWGSGSVTHPKYIESSAPVNGSFT